MCLPLAAAPVLFAQDDDEGPAFELDPFVVAGDENIGYMATHTLAGTRIRTDLRDVGSAISVITEEFLQDTGATDNQSLLQYTTNSEVAGPQGNYTGVGNSGGANEGDAFQRPNAQTRVRGLAAADNTRDYFLTNIPWDGYNVARVDMQRGPNAILFGLGSPAGIINTTLTPADFYDGGEVELRFGSYGSNRLSANINQEIIEGELAVRVAAVRDHEEFKQKPAFEDDERFYAALRYDPQFLRFEGARTTIRANFETGDIERNRPRTLTPIDNITPFFQPVRNPDGTFPARGGVGGQLFDVYETVDNNEPYDPGRGQRQPTLQNSEPNPDFVPAVGSFAQVFGGPVFFFDAGSPNSLGNAYQSEWRLLNGLAPDGSIDGSIEGLQYQRPSAIANYAQYARNATYLYGDEAARANLPYADFGQYKSYHLQDASIFDFYNNLLDGPTKREWANWDARNINLAQTILDNRVGVELAYDYQHYTDGAVRMFQDQQAAINVDINESWADGSPNPNAGRPFISDSNMYGNNEFTSEREVFRATAFAEFRATDVMEESWVSRLLGRYVFTGLYSEDTDDQERLNWMRYGTPQSWAAAVNEPNMMGNVRAVNNVVYLGESLVGRSSASGLNIPRITANIDPQTTQMLYFNSTWNAPNVDPSALWINTVNGEEQTQSENPANYVGFDTMQVPVLDSEEGNRYELMRGAQLSKLEVDSWAIIGQAYWWDGAVVGTLGYREDKVKSYDHQEGQVQVNWNGQLTPTGWVDTRSDSYRLPDEPNLTLSDDSLSKSLAVHFHRLPYGEHLPIEISGYYSNSSNFQPAAGRRDILGQLISPPTGETTDYSILLATKDNRFSLKVTKYETTVENQSSDYIGGTWFIGGVEAWGNNWANIFELDNNNGEFGVPTGENTYAPAPGETEEDAAAREQAAIAGWRAHQENVRALSEEITGDPNAFYDAWGIDVGNTGKNAQSQTDPQGLAFTQDSISEGYEFEFTANPTSNWRISFNASETKAIRNNVGGEVVARWVEMVENDLNNTPAGDLRIWWGGAGNNTTLDEWNGTFASNYALTQLQEGTATPEIRRWRFNLVTNYAFDEGFLRGLNLGAGYRWQDKVVIGYPLMEGADGTTTFDLGNPYYGPEEDAIDLWVGYSRAISDTLDWRIQLNVRNVGDGNKLIPISTQPDGSWAAVRIAPHQEWFITNTISF